MSKGILIMGTMGSGKDEVADILKEYGYTKVKLGKDIKENVDKYNYNNKPTRPLYQQYGQLCRQLFGEDVWNAALAREILKMKAQYKINNFAIADGRQNNEFEFWKARGFITIGIVADADLRDKRIIKRDGTSQKEYFNHSTEIEAMECVKKCDYIVENNESLSALKIRVKMIANMID